ncbi:hypothetical protein OAU99_00860 [Candidatus Poseidoniaceae archaeon]|nr:hypothetical protein [Candidatus Poseidoniaceae archaeon]
MRNISCWLIVAILALQVSISGIEMTNDDNSELNQSNEEVTNFAGRQSSGMSGNVTVESDCNLTNWPNSADGLGGPVWQNNSYYEMYSIVEWPANSGHFYQNTANTSASPDDGPDHWDGPCTCAEIGEHSGIVWDSTMSYNPWQIVDHNGVFWIAQDAGTMAGDEPVSSSDLWVQCSHEDTTPCDELIGNGQITVWDNTTLVSSGEIYEFPVNSGDFYMAASFLNNQTTGEPGVDLDAWEDDYCDCKDIWFDSGEPVWDSSVNYLQNAVVEWPAGSSNLYISFDHGVGIEPNGPDDYLWRLCVGEEPSGNLCDEFNGYGGMVWDNMTLVSTGEIYEYPAGSGEFHSVAPGFSNQTVGAPGIDFQSWSKESCSCNDIWMTAGSPVWDSNTIYDVGIMVEYPIGTGDIWMAIVSQTTTGVTPDQEFADGNEWELCGGEEPAEGPCGGLISVGVWSDPSRVSTGEIYQYPAGSGDYYEVIIQGYLDQEVNPPTLDMDVWAPVDCPCEEEWMANGEPVWTPNTAYSGSDVVEWPAGSGDLYMTLETTGVSATNNEPGNDTHWVLCSSTDEPPAITPCAGLTIVGIWDSSMNVTSGEIYEFSGMYYQVNPGSPFWSVSAPDIDMDVWTPIDCPCKETWAANGEPVWDGTVPYLQNDVVEWPAGSGHLYMAEGDASWVGSGMGTQTPEPTTDDYWIPCDNYTTMPSGNPCAGLDVLGVWDSSMTVSSGEVYEYPANSDTYYQVNQGSPFTSVSAPDIDMDVWSPIDCPCKETWVANNQPVWDASVDYPGNYVVEWPAGTGNLYIPLEPTGVGIGAEPGVDIHWVLCEGEGPSPGPCDGLNVPVWDNSTAPAVGDIYQYPANSGDYYQIIFIHADSAGGPDWVSYPDESGADEFWVPYSCPCKPTWVANGQPVWEDTITFYSGNYVVEWPANSGALYIAEAGGITGAGEPGIDGHWIPCDGNPEIESEDEDEAEDDSIPSIGVALTLVGILSAAGFISRSKKQ